MLICLKTMIAPNMPDNLSRWNRVMEYALLLLASWFRLGVDSIWNRCFYFWAALCRCCALLLAAHFALSFLCGMEEVHWCKDTWDPPLGITDASKSLGRSQFIGSRMGNVYLSKHNAIFFQYQSSPSSYLFGVVKLTRSEHLNIPVGSTVWVLDWFLHAYRISAPPFQDNKGE